LLDTDETHGYVYGEDGQINRPLNPMERSPHASGQRSGHSSMSREKAKELNLEVFGTIRSYASGGVDPAYMGLGPIPAVRKALKKAKISLNDIGLIELNEAFASQSIACVRELKFDMEKTNVNGSGVSLGHPIGCTGPVSRHPRSRMKRRKVNLGLTTLCIGGGQGMAVIVEKS
jgi:acetyl-CoA C-acetyltransferase